MLGPGGAPRTCIFYLSMQFMLGGLVVGFILHVFNLIRSCKRGLCMWAAVARRAYPEVCRGVRVQQKCAAAFVRAGKKTRYDCSPMLKLHCLQTLEGELEYLGITVPLSCLPAFSSLCSGHIVCDLSVNNLLCLYNMVCTQGVQAVKP